MVWGCICGHIVAKNSGGMQLGHIIVSAMHYCSNLVILGRVMDRSGINDNCWLSNHSIFFVYTEKAVLKL